MVDGGWKAGWCREKRGERVMWRRKRGKMDG